MTLNEIKLSLFGYNKNDVCSYISELNSIHSAEISAAEDRLKTESDSFAAERSTLSRENADLKENCGRLEEELCSLKERISELEEKNASLSEQYSRMKIEADDFRNKSELISTAIINAEKCAGELISDASDRASGMISDAEARVEQEVKRLDTAKRYIEEIRANVAATMKNIDSALSNAERNISSKKESLNKPAVPDGDTDKQPSRDKFGILDRGLFRKA